MGLAVVLEALCSGKYRENFCQSDSPSPTDSESTESQNIVIHVQDANT